VQTCSRCNTQSPDSATQCPNCKADLPEFSTVRAALKNFQSNTRVRHIILAIDDDACPACHNLQGAYPKDKAPLLPVEGCSHPQGCRCFYQPVLSEIYP